MFAFNHFTSNGHFFDYRSVQAGGTEIAGCEVACLGRPVTKWIAASMAALGSLNALRFEQLNSVSVSRYKQ